MAANPELEIAKLQRQLAQLDQRMASGIKAIEGGDGTGGLTNASYAEMRLARSDLVKRIGALNGLVAGTGGIRRTRQVVITGRNGF